MNVESFLLLLVLAFAVFRLAEMITLDEGPADVFFWLRARAGVYDLTANGRIATSFGRMMECPHCIGVWLAFVGASFWTWWAGYTNGMYLVMFVVAWLAMAGLQSFLESIGGRAGR